MHNESILNLLGLAKKAGRLELGEEPVGAACRARKARLVLLARDAAPNTHRRAAHFGEAGGVLWLELPFTKAELGRLFGRTSCALLALTDTGFAAALAKKMAQADPSRFSPAATQLQDKADRVYLRQQEQRRHEKKLRQGKAKPWAPPPRPQPPPAGAGVKPGGNSGGKPGRKPGATGTPPPARPVRPARPGKPGASQMRQGGSGRTQKPGPGSRRLSGAIPKKRGGSPL